MSHTASLREAVESVLSAHLQRQGLLVTETPRDTDGVLALPVSDRANVAFAVGLALGGRSVVVELTSTARLAAAVEVLAEAASVANAGEFSVPLVLRVPYGGEAGDRVDRPIGDLLASIPGLRVVCPSSPGTAAGLLRSAVLSTHPVVFLEPRALADQRGPVDEGPLDLASARVLREGHHLTLVAWGAAVSASLDAADQLSQEGLSVGVVDLVSLHPVDRACLSAQVRTTGRVLAVHPGDAGLAERVLRVGLHEAFEYLESPPALADARPAALAQAARDSIHW